MCEKKLTAFWIKSPCPRAPLGFGVTAWSLEDALQIIQALDYGTYLPADLALLDVVTGVTVDDLDQPHVISKMGPIIVRGIWYPFLAIGIPNWALERIRLNRSAG
jgi:hypothetical protein